MNKLTVGSCFSGIGGIELGLEWTGGFETRWQIENELYASGVLQKHWPHVARYGDIRTINPAQLERVDVICGGYPCQPFSFAGHRAGETDVRHLWPDMFRIVRALRPRFVLLENVPGHLSMGFGRVLGDLAECGYDAEWQVLSAAGVGAPHLRRRVFIIANNDRSGGRIQSVAVSEREETPNAGTNGSQEFMADTAKPQLYEAWQRDRCQGRTTIGSSRSGWWAVEPNVGRVAHGVPSRSHRLKCLGNAVVPQVAQKIGEMILRFHDRAIPPPTI